mmetsp:Transcript_3074/g.9568  ORF Transcript_3074/g.9568 Transcript_3074/m.9568 type:complete len:91 (-) Transcript_3074:239-511(-)
MAARWLALRIPLATSARPRATSQAAGPSDDDCAPHASRPEPRSKPGASSCAAPVRPSRGLLHVGFLADALRLVSVVRLWVVQRVIDDLVV